MNRERLTILRDHLASLPDERVNMAAVTSVVGEPEAEAYLIADDLNRCGTAACIAGWACALFGERGQHMDSDVAADLLSITGKQDCELFTPPCWNSGAYTRSDAIAAIQSMLDSPDDDALPVWPEKAEVAS